MLKQLANLSSLMISLHCRSEIRIITRSSPSPSSTHTINSTSLIVSSSFHLLPTHTFPHLHLSCSSSFLTSTLTVPTHKLDLTRPRGGTQVKYLMVMQTELAASTSMCMVPRLAVIHKVLPVTSRSPVTSSMLPAERSKLHLNQFQSQPALLLRTAL